MARFSLPRRSVDRLESFVGGVCRTRALDPAHDGPELFVLDRFGNASAVGDGRVPPGFEEKARLAVANCPELAIEIVED